MNIGSFLLLGWLNQAVYRYVNAFKGRKGFTLLHFLYVVVVFKRNFVILGFAGILIVNQELMMVTVICSYFMFVTYNTTSSIINSFSNEKVKLLLFLSLFSVTMKLYLQYSCI